MIDTWFKQDLDKIYKKLFEWHNEIRPVENFYELKTNDIRFMVNVDDDFIINNIFDLKRGNYLVAFYGDLLFLILEVRDDLS